ncbi:hypothetical protein GIB67_003394 [Kingdonia uniflora]|uniref:Uncharacterized protein n=1 Tax=Kingdonia uniflora TaxID=39325 RepID=A0A7J7P909_9MAGN|nr:hypothetical protein GIB67_003394 [Kingdonia uniflora]
MMSTLAVEIFDRHLGDIKFQFGETIIQMNLIHVCLILGLRVSPIVNEFSFVDPEHMTNFRIRRFPKKKNTYRRCSLIKFVKNYTIFSPPEQGEKRLGEPKFPRIEESIHLFPKLQGWRMTSFKRRQIVTLKKFFANPDLLVIAMKPLETDMQQNLVQEAMVIYHSSYQIKAPTIGAVPTISAPAVGVSTVVALAIGSSSSATEIGAVVVRVCFQLEDKMLLKLDDHGKMLHTHGKMLERISMFTMGEGTLPLGDTPLLGQYQFSTPEKTVKRKRERGLIPKIPKKGLVNRVPRKRRVQFPKLQNIQSTAKSLLQQVVSGEILEVANSLMVDDDVEVGREVNFNAISSEYGGDLLYWKKGEEKNNDDKKDVEEKVKSEEEEVQEASADQTTFVSIEGQTLEVEKTEDEARQPVLMESEVGVTLKKRHTLTEEENNERTFKIAYRMNQLNAHLDELLLRGLLESFIQRPISQDEKNQMDQVWPLRKDKLSPEAWKGNRIPIC